MSLRVRLWRTKQSHAPRDVIPAQAGIQHPPFWKGGKGDFKVLSPLEVEIRACPEPCPEPCPELAEGLPKDEGEEFNHRDTGCRALHLAFRIRS